jgi:hypothetical protein
VAAVDEDAVLLNWINLALMPILRDPAAHRESIAAMREDQAAWPERRRFFRITDDRGHLLAAAVLAYVDAAQRDASAGAIAVHLEIDGGELAEIARRYIR